MRELLSVHLTKRRCLRGTTCLRYRIKNNVVGPLTAAFGFLLAGVSMKLLKTQEILSLYISGGLVGLGFGCMYLTALDVIEIYFDK